MKRKHLFALKIEGMVNFTASNSSTFMLGACPSIVQGPSVLIPWRKALQHFFEASTFRITWLWIVIKEYQFCSLKFSPH